MSNAPAFPSTNVQPLVQAWVRGTVPNFGLLLKDPGPNLTTLWTSEYGNTFSRPSLYVCYTVTCDPGFADCNDDGRDGCETDLDELGRRLRRLRQRLRDAERGARLRERRVRGRRVQPGLRRLRRRRRANGCETLLTTNANCGACGVACALAERRRASCATGTCALTACNAGFYDCDGDPANGCEADALRRRLALRDRRGLPRAASARAASARRRRCTDGVQNGAETAVDCGGGDLPALRGRRRLRRRRRLRERRLRGRRLPARVAAPTASKNGAETGVDCGGGDVPALRGRASACLVGDRLRERRVHGGRLPGADLQRRRQERRRDGGRLRRRRVPAVRRGQDLPRRRATASTSSARAASARSATAPTA